MLINTKYDNIKVVYKLSKIAWYIKECALPEAKKHGNTELTALYDQVIKDLNQHTDALYNMICKSCSSD